MKKISLILALVLLASIAIGCASAPPAPAAAPGAEPAAGSRAGETLRIGVVVPFGTNSGIVAMEAVNMFFADIGWEVAGRPVQLFFEDCRGVADVAVQRLTRLVERENVPLILGPLAGASGSAAAAFAAAGRMPNTTMIVGSAGSVGITLNTPPNVFRGNASGLQSVLALGTYAYEVLGHRRVVTLATDYDFTFAQVAGFAYGFIHAGGEVVDRLWFSRGDMDFGSVIAMIPPDIDAIFMGIAATDSVNFMRQYGDFGFDIPILSGGNFTDITVLTTDIGYRYEGVFGANHFAQDLPFPEFVEFNDKFVERTGRDASQFAADFYIISRLAVMAIEELDGNIEDQEAFRRILSGLQFDTPRGPFRFCPEFNQAIVNVYITQVKRGDDGVLRNVVIETIPETTQFGPFCPIWFHEQPLPDRIHPTDEAIRAAVVIN